MPKTAVDTERSNAVIRWTWFFELHIGHCGMRDMVLYFTWLVIGVVFIEWSRYGYFSLIALMNLSMSDLDILYKYRLDCMLFI